MTEHMKKINTKKLKPGLVAFYDIQSETEWAYSQRSG